MGDRRTDQQVHGAAESRDGGRRTRRAPGARRRRPQRWLTLRRQHTPEQRAAATGVRAPSPAPSTDVPKSLAATYPDRRRHIGLFAAGLLVSIVLLVLLGYVVGHGPNIGLGGFVESVLTAATGPVTATVFAFTLLACAAWCIRRLWLERLAWRPGQVVVPVFTAGTKLGDADPVQLTALFRQRFATLRLQSPAPVPGSPPEGGFVEVLGQRNVDGRNPLNALLALAQAAKPTHAYVVHGVLAEREGDPKYGVTVQVVRWPEEGTPPETVYDISWERALRRAADRAMAYILPRTKLCTAPWASWRGFIMPPQLLETYEAAATFEQDRRYDQALARYFEAVELDPMNLSLRMNIGHLQEKLGLYVDALATYEGIIAVAEAAGRPGQRRLFRPAAQRERERVLVLSRYRRLVLLGGPPLGEQWRHTSPPETWTERDDQRVELRDRLRGRLAQQLGATLAAHGPRGSAAMEPLSLQQLLAEPERPCPPADDRVLHQLRRVLVLHALDQLEPLSDALRRLKLTRGDAPLALTQTSLALTKLCLEERCRWIEHQLDHPERWIWDAGELERLRESVSAAVGGDRVLGWHEHYNAACVFALPLLVRDDSRPDIRDALARHAVAHLEQATSCADSGYIANRRDWLLSEDPDLNGLRAHRAFKAFEAMYFPSPAPVPRRPRHIQRLEVSTYTRELLDATARRWHTEWHARRDSGALDNPHALIEWWQHEAESWHLVGRVAWNHRRWRVRYDLLEAMDASSVHYGGAPLEVAFRPFSPQCTGTQSEQATDRLAREALDEGTEQLRALAEALRDQRGDPGRFGVWGIDRWIERLRDKEADGEAARADDVRMLCNRHAAVWEALHLWLVEHGAGRDAGADRFARRLEKLSAQLVALA